MTWDEYLNAKDYFNKYDMSSASLIYPESSNHIADWLYGQFADSDGRPLRKENNDMKKEATKPDSNKLKNSYEIINHIASIETINDRVVIVHFKDGSFTKADCGQDNPFDFDILFTIAILKRLLDEKKGSNLYHKLIRHGHKILKAQEKKDEEEKRLRDIREHRKMKKIKKKADREARFIEIHKKILTEVIIDANRMAQRQCLVKATEDDLK